MWRSGIFLSNSGTAVVLLLLAAIGIAAPSWSAERDGSLRAAAVAVHEAVVGTTGCTGDDIVLGVWGLDREATPFPDVVSGAIDRTVVAALLETRPNCVRVIDSAGVGAIITHATRASGTGADHITRAIARHRNADFIAFPSVLVRADTALVSLRVVEATTGETAALLREIALPRALWDTSPQDKALSLDVAIERAATALTREIGVIRSIQVDGLFFAGTRAQPEGAQYLRERLLGAIIAEGSNPLTGHRIRTRGISLEPGAPSASLRPSLDPTALAMRDGAHVLTGRYWVRDDVVELVVTLKAPDGGTVTWHGSVPRKDLSGLAIEPQSTSLSEIAPARTSFSFLVTTPDGPYPIYRAGQELTLYLLAGRAAHAYCLFVDSRGTLFPIVPLPSGGLDRARLLPLTADEVSRFPDPQRHEMRLVLDARTLGEEYVRCFAFESDISRRLPGWLFPDRLTPLEGIDLAAIRKLFEALSGVRAAESTVTISLQR